MTQEQYTIISKIGEGGMGTVYLAEDNSLERQVAIKELNKSALTSGELTESRFQQEALALAKLNHPNITHLYAFLPQAHTWWMVMEYVAGKTLEDWLAIHKKMNPALACGIALQLLDGLRHAHRKGIIHRDLKPANIMVSEEGEAKIMDFGIARIRHSQRITRHGKSVGTLEYMAPEQIQGQEGDERTDIYAVGNILYEMLCGQTPFAGDTDYHLMKAKLEQPPPPVANFAPTAPPALQKLILKALEKNPEKRYASADELKEALEKSISGIASQPQVIYQLVHGQPQPVAGHTKAGTISRDSQNPSKRMVLLQKLGKMPRRINVDGRKPANAIIILAVSVLICLALLFWNYQRNQVPDDDENANLTVAKDDTAGEKATSEGLIERQLQQNKQPVENAPSTPPNAELPEEKTAEPPVQKNPLPAKEKPAKPQERNKQKETIPVAPTQPESPTPLAPITPPAVEKYGGPTDVPAGRTVTLVLDETLSSEEKQKDGNIIRLRCAEVVEVNGRIIVRNGALAEGKIVDVIPSSAKKKALIGFVILRVETVDGNMLKLGSQRFRNEAGQPGTAVFYQRGQRFTAETKRGRVQ